MSVLNIDLGTEALTTVPLFLSSFPSQAQFIQMWRSLYDLFTDSVEEQGLYHSIATVGTLLLQIGEVGKRFRHNTDTSSASGGISPIRDVGEGLTQEKDDKDERVEIEGEEDGKADDEAKNLKTKVDDTEDVKSAEALDKGGEGEGKSVVAEDVNSTDGPTVVKTADGQGGDAAETNNKTDSNLPSIPEVQLSPAENNPVTNSPKNTSKPDADWSISFEQLLASMLTEPPLVDFFERIYDTTDAVASLRNRRLITRMQSASPEKS